MLQKLSTSLLACALLACDTPSPDLAIVAGDANEDVSFREQGPSDVWVITSWDQKAIKFADFGTIATMCGSVGQPVLTCTLTGYLPDITMPTRVAGVGCSAYFSPELWECYLDAFKKNDAIKYP